MVKIEKDHFWLVKNEREYNWSKNTTDKSLDLYEKKMRKLYISWIHIPKRIPRHIEFNYSTTIRWRVYFTIYGSNIVTLHFLNGLSGSLFKNCKGVSPCFFLNFDLFFKNCKGVSPCFFTNFGLFIKTCKGVSPCFFINLGLFFKNCKGVSPCFFLNFVSLLKKM